jgi:hypothetical protein
LVSIITQGGKCYHHVADEVDAQRGNYHPIHITNVVELTTLILSCKAVHSIHFGKINL